MMFWGKVDQGRWVVRREHLRSEKERWVCNGNLRYRSEEKNDVKV
jgi:hypothetical protein